MEDAARPLQSEEPKGDEIMQFVPREIEVPVERVPRSLADILNDLNIGSTAPRVPFGMHLSQAEAIKMDRAAKLNKCNAPRD
jgi:hypothetical protein